MATSAVAELRRLRTAGIDDPDRVVEIGRKNLSKGGFGSAGDECNHLSCDMLIFQQTL